MPGTDVKRELKGLYNPSAKEISIVDVPPMNYLMIDGQGDPNTSQAYVDALSALYTVSYTLKFAIKKRAPSDDFTVMPLEGLWWSPDSRDFSMIERGEWRWTAMIVQPPVVTREAVAEAIQVAAKKKPLAAIDLLRFESFCEGLCAQILYFGAYKDEGPAIRRLHEFIGGQGYVPAGKHHEIYLGDPRRTAPEKLKTVIRQHMERADTKAKVESP